MNMKLMSIFKVRINIYFCSQNNDTAFSDDQKQTPLYWAIRNGSLEIVRYLVEHGADVNHQGKNQYLFLFMNNDTAFSGNQNWTPLYWAAWNGNLEIVRYLVEHGADVNLQGKNQYLFLFTE